MTKRGYLSRENRPLKNTLVKSRIPSELSAEDVRAVRADNRLQREIAQSFGLTSSAVSLIKARKCRADVPELVVPPPEPPKIIVFVCPPAKAAGHKPLRKQMLKLNPVAKSWQPTTRPIITLNTVATTTPPMPQEHHLDDWLLF